MSLQPHERILPAFDLSEEGLRQLEIWLLERLAGDGGLQYHKAQVYGPHNIGDWLQVETTSSGTEGSAGIEFLDNVGNANWMLIRSNGGQITIDKTAGGIFPLFAAFLSDLSFDVDNGEVLLRGNSSGDIQFFGTGDGSLDVNGTMQVVGGALLRLIGASVRVEGDSSEVDIGQDGGTFTVNDHLGSPLVTYTG